MERLLRKLNEIESQHNEIAGQLSNPEVISNQNRFKELSKTYSDMTEIVTTYREYKRVLTELTGARELLQSTEADMAELAREETSAKESEAENIEKRLKVLLLPKDPYDEKNIILEIRAGTGGEEAALFAADLYRMYERFAERQGWNLEILSINSTGLRGFKEIIASLSGKRVYSALKYESGVHRVQRVPETEASGRIHTSAVTVAVLPEADDIDIQIDEKDLRIDRFCSSGPGGQSVNTTYSAVRITHIPTGLVVSCQDEKSQHKNRERAMKVLRSRLFQMEQDKQMEEISTSRRAMVKSGDRSEKIRTYNFPQNRVTDHRVNLTLYRLSDILDGDLNLLIEPIILAFQSELMEKEFDKSIAK